MIHVQRPNNRLSFLQPALTKVFDVALAGGGAKSINFQELAADLAEITFGEFCVLVNSCLSWSRSSV